MKSNQDAPQTDIELTTFGLTSMHVQNGYTGKPRPGETVAQQKAPPASPPPLPKKKD